MRLLAKISKISSFVLVVAGFLSIVCFICGSWVQGDTGAKLIIYAFYIFAFPLVFWIIVWSPEKYSAQDINIKG